MTNDIAIRFCDEYLARHIADIDKEFLKKAKEALQQESKTGHWIYDKNIENWRCSECGETPKTLGYCGTADFMAEHFKYCNHCGIRMVEPQEREIHCTFTDSEIAKSFIEDVEAVKDLLPRTESEE